MFDFFFLTTNSKIRHIFNFNYKALEFIATIAIKCQLKRFHKNIQVYVYTGIMTIKIRAPDNF